MIDDGPTDEEFEAAIRRHYALLPLVIALASAFAFPAFLIGYGSVSTAIYGIPSGLLFGSIAMLFIRRFAGGIDAPKFRAAKQRRIERLKLERQQHVSLPPAAASGDLSTFQKYALASLLCGILFAIGFFVVSGFRAEMGLGGIVIGLISGPAIYRSGIRRH